MIMINLGYNKTIFGVDSFAELFCQLLQDVNIFDIGNQRLKRYRWDLLYQICLRPEATEKINQRNCQHQRLFY